MHCTTLHYIALRCTTLHYTTLHYIALHSTDRLVVLVILVEGELSLGKNAVDFVPRAVTRFLGGALPLVLARQQTLEALVSR